MKFDKLINFILEKVGMKTYWQNEDGSKKITIKDVIKELDRQNIPIKKIPLSKLRPILINQDYEEKGKERVAKASLEYPIIVVISNGKYKSILDGNHRVFKALNQNINTIEVRELNLDSKATPKIYKQLFNYEIEKI
jgi:hypothetical protein